MEKSEILPGVEEFVNKLRENNIKIAIASASKNTRTILERLGLEKKFDVIIDGTMIDKAKPNPEIF